MKTLELIETNTESAILVAESRIRVLKKNVSIYYSDFLVLNWQISICYIWLWQHF